jgi:transglutaminase-like putative cysteine protease
VPRGAARRLVAAVLPVSAVMFAWATLEAGANPVVFVVVAAASLPVALPVRERARWLVAAPVLCGAAIVLVRIAPGSVGDVVDRGLADAYTIATPFPASRHPELHVLVVLLGAAFAVGVAATAGRRPFVAATITAAGIGIPATVNPSRNTIAMGAVALVAVLWPVAVAGMADRGGLAPGATIVAGVTVAAVVLTGIGARPSAAALDWRNWDLFGESSTGRTVALVWTSNYSGIDFPAKKTTILRVSAPRRALYWRATTLDTFIADRWVEALYTSDSPGDGRLLPPDPLLPAAARIERNWVRQGIEERTLVDGHVIAATQPVAIESGEDGPPRFLSGGVMIKRGGDAALSRYEVWSYAPNPTPQALARSPAAYPRELTRYLDVGRPSLPPFGTPGRSTVVDAIFTDERYQPLFPYRALWRDARRLTSGSRSPFEATALIERWLRSRGGFAYDQHPPTPNGLPPLVDFEQRSKRGYCQQFAGTMTLMLRYLGIPARVAVGFTSGTWKDGSWTVTDHDAHAWVEVWFADYGWLPFDPTPGRGTLSSTYTNASDSAEALRALGSGRFLGSDAAGRTPTRRGAPVPPVTPAEKGFAWRTIAPFAVLIALLALLTVAKVTRPLRLASVRDPRGRASAARAELAAFICDQGAPVTLSAPMWQLATELRALGVASNAFTTAFSRARYGPLEGAQAASDEVRAELRTVLSALRGRLGHGRRLRGFLSVRSLRRS